MNFIDWTIIASAVLFALGNFLIPKRDFLQGIGWLYVIVYVLIHTNSELGNDSNYYWFVLTLAAVLGIVWRILP